MKPTVTAKLAVVLGVGLLLVLVYFLWAWAFQFAWNYIAPVYWADAPILTYGQAAITLALKVLIGINLHYPSASKK